MTITFEWDVTKRKQERNIWRSGAGSAMRVARHVPGKGGGGALILSHLHVNKKNQI